MEKIQIALEIFLSVILIITLFYGLTVRKALFFLKKDKRNFDAMIAKLENNLDNIHHNINNIKKTSNELEVKLLKSINEGFFLKEELEKIYKKSEKFMLNSNIISSEGNINLRKNTRLSNDDDDINRKKFSFVNQGKSQAEKQLIEALRRKKV
ncbi:hypothetical protein [Swingsia samuiensis]|uniref:Uncharacterized protein n=1 Tax=Swingsia samuiensis TaxID=1293412 RepID=A0A4Y6UHS8_9PROT|nr:hypothetical protein [Swingsia samuiensis]QDH17133.1 hypothetical protein E3D00_05815 [Swingsia samuiensis]